MNTKTIPCAIGVDIGGSHITAAAIDLNEGRLLTETYTRVPLNAMADAKTIFMIWICAIKKAIDAVGKEKIRGIGIAMPGPFDYENGISLINDEGQKKYLSLYKRNVKQELEKQLSVKENNILFKNDAECFLLGEVYSGACIGAKNAIGITLGSGLGSAELINDASKDKELWCAPFRKSIAEDYMSARWFVKRYKELCGKNVSDVKTLAYLAGKDEAAKTVFSEFGRTLSEFLIPVITKNYSEVCVIGGNISQASSLFLNHLEQDASKHVPYCKIMRSALLENASLTGAAYLFK